MRLRRLTPILALAMLACDNHPCWPDGPPPELFCPVDRPYVNPYHPGECFADPQPGGNRLDASAPPLDTTQWIPRAEVRP